MIAQLVSACRAAGIRISAAETLDAVRAASEIGLSDRAALKMALGQALAKTAGDKDSFSACFDRYVRLTDQDTKEDLSSSDRMEVSLKLMQAASQIGLDEIKLFTQRGLYMRRLLDAAEAMDETAPQAGQDGGRGGGGGGGSSPIRAEMAAQARYMVDRQLEISQGANMLRVRSEMLMDAPLDEADQRDLEIMSYQVRRLAKRLASQKARRQKRSQRGRLDFSRSLRANLKNDGQILNLIWKKKKISHPRIYALCDVSGSVSSAVRFLLMFLYHLTDIAGDVRAFAFSNRLGEVSGLFRETEFGAAYGQALRLYGGGSTDYGQSMRDFDAQAGRVIDRKTIIIILGDARSNYGDCGAEILSRLSARSARVLWLNPEAESLWGSGDSEMPRLRASCHEVYACRTLRQLTDIIDEMMRLRV